MWWEAPLSGYQQIVAEGSVLAMKAWGRGDAAGGFSIICNEGAEGKATCVGLEKLL